MSGMDGIQLAYCIKEESPFTQVVLLMTGHGDVSMAVGNLRAGAFSFFSKPLNLDEVTEAPVAEKYKETTNLL